MCEENSGKVLLRLRVGASQTLLSRITCRSRDQLGLQPGMRLRTGEKRGVDAMKVAVRELSDVCIVL